LAERDVVIIVACPGHRPYHAHVQALLHHAVQIPGTHSWFVSTCLTGPLKPPAPAPADQ
jgi:hypothetical protein